MLERQRSFGEAGLLFVDVWRHALYVGLARLARHAASCYSSKRFFFFPRLSSITGEQSAHQSAKARNAARLWGFHL